MKTKQILALALCLVSLFFCLTSCGGGIDMGEAEIFADEFFNVVGRGDIETANTYLHPDVPLQLDSYLEDVEREDGISFANGITIERQTGFSYAYYDMRVGGSYYERSLRGKVGNTAVYITVAVVQNEAGYGIYDLAIEV